MTRTEPASRPRAAFAQTDTPDGPFLVIASPEAVLASGWTDDVDWLRLRIAPALRPELDDEPTELLGRAMRAVRGYYSGELDGPDAIPVRDHLTGFRARARDALRATPAGAAISYGQLAEAAGSAQAARAAASVCSGNPAALFVPCHRVVRADGSVGQFLFGSDLKAALLKRERASLRRGSARF